MIIYITDSTYLLILYSYGSCVETGTFTFDPIDLIFILLNLIEGGYGYKASTRKHCRFSLSVLFYLSA